MRNVEPTIRKLVSVYGSPTSPDFYPDKLGRIYRAFFSDPFIRDRPFADMFPSTQKKLNLEYNVYIRA